MMRYEYMQLKLSDMPEDIIAYYHLLDIATPNKYFNCKIRQGMFGLRQAGIITQELMATRLKDTATTRAKQCLGCGHMSGIQSPFSLVVNDFRVNT
jgi:hypothetical protein